MNAFLFLLSNTWLKFHAAFAYSVFVFARLCVYVGLRELLDFHDVSVFSSARFHCGNYSLGTIVLPFFAMWYFLLLKITFFSQPNSSVLLSRVSVFGFVLKNE